jgi:PAS domain S-box-containing protein
MKSVLLEIYERNGVIAYAAAITPDGTSRLTFVTSNVERLLGHPAAALCEPGAWQAHIHPADREIHARIAGAAPGEPLTLEYRFQHADGQYRWVRDQLVKHPAAPAAPVTTQGVILDITAERATADELRRTVAFVEAVLDNIPAMIFMKDADELRFSRLNRAGEELLGLHRAALLGKNDYDFFPAEQADFFTSKDRAVLEGRRPLEIPEEPIETPRGQRWLHTRKTPVLDPITARPTHLLGISFDITERKEAAAKLVQGRLELEARTLELQRSNAELEQFASVTSHDLQEPLRMIKSFAELLAQTQGEHLDADGRQFLRYVIEGAERMRQLIRDLLLYARVGRQSSSMEVVDLQAVLDDTLQDLQLRIRETGGRVTHDPMPTTVVDRHRIGQVFQNLIGNALKFHGQAPPEIHVGVEEQPDTWVFHVRDNGIGIDRRFTERIFRVFQRLHPRGRYEGNGVGLAVVKKIAEQHGGRAWVQSTPGEGSVFSFALAKPPAPGDGGVSEDEPTDTPGRG